MGEYMRTLWIVFTSTRNEVEP